MHAGGAWGKTDEQQSLDHCTDGIKILMAAWLSVNHFVWTFTFSDLNSFIMF
jgi:hypothetical protein